MWLALAFCSCLFSGPVAADAPLDSLGEARRALQSAWQQHPTALAAAATLQAVRARSRAAGQPLYNPEVELAVDHEGTDELRTIGLSQSLDVSGKGKARRELGDAELSLGEAQYALTRAEFVRDWLIGWARLASSGRQLTIGAERVLLAQRMADLAERQFAAGDISGPERDLVLLARDEAVAEQASLVADAAAARETLARAGGNVPLSSAPTLPDEPPPVPVPHALAELEVTDLPELVVARAEEATAEQRVLVAKHDRCADPTLTVRGGTIDSEAGKGTVIGLAISIPLFVRNNFRAETEAARFDADSANALVRSQRQDLLARAESAFSTYAAMRAAWLSWRSSRGTDLTTRSKVLERLWTAGELSTSDYVLQLKQTLDTALAGAALEGRLWQSYFEYLYAIGELDSWARPENRP
jgi:outer membrane protein, heavy metal efflux system